MLELLTGIIFYFGAIIGSFLNVVILRLPDERKLTGRSSCNFCGHTLEPIDLFPLFSFVLLRGRCRHCHKAISPRYFIIELLAGLIFAGFWLILAPTNLAEAAVFIKSCFIASVLICVFIIDLEHFIILDSVVFFSSAVVLVFNIFLSRSDLWTVNNVMISGAMAAILGALPFWLIWYFSQGRWMGFGDVKLGLFLGLALGWPQIFVAYFIAILLGGFISVILLAFTKKNLKSQIPFGTFLSLGALISLFYGPRLLHWYMAFLGF